MPKLNLFHIMLAVSAALHLIAYGVLTTQTPVNDSWAAGFVFVLATINSGLATVAAAIHERGK